MTTLTAILSEAEAAGRRGAKFGDWWLRAVCRLAARVQFIRQEVHDQALAAWEAGQRAAGHVPDGTMPAGAAGETNTRAPGQGHVAGRPRSLTAPDAVGCVLTPRATKDASAADRRTGAKKGAPTVAVSNLPGQTAARGS